ncbi:MAG: rfaF [Anaerosporomusa subterranea]|jgi:heptosyltransferase-1|nr:rfaF [Anaerosporomusa subterranea]
MMKRILIVKLSAIGDVIHALPVAHALKAGFPDCKITWVVEKPALELVKANAYVDEVIVFEKGQCKTWSGIRQYAPGFISELRRRRFDLSLDLQGLFKSAAIASLSGATERLVYCNARELSNWMGKRVCGPNQGGHIVEQYLDVVRALGVNCDSTDFGLTIPDEVAATTEALANFAGLDMTQDYVLLAPGANWPNKRWQPEHFAALADKLFDDKLIPVLTGGPGDDYFSKDILKAALIPPIDLTGRTTLLELAQLIRHAKLVVGGDTGPVHLATALNTPVLMLMGPTNPERNGPYGKRNAVLTVPYECAGCWKRECRYGKECLTVLSPDAVYQEAIKLLKGLTIIV